MSYTSFTTNTSSPNISVTLTATVAPFFASSIIDLPSLHRGLASHLLQISQQPLKRFLITTLIPPIREIADVPPSPDGVL